MKIRGCVGLGLLASTAVIWSTTLLASDDNAGTEKTISARMLADVLHRVLEADRAVYTKQVVNRLTRKDKVITASEHYKDEQALPLPAQMFRMGSEQVAAQLEKEGAGLDFSYSLQSLWPINKQNEPRTAAEKAGLQYVVDNPGKNFYRIEQLGDREYFTAIYPDRAVSPACVSCHNEHRDSPRTDFKLKQTMGAVVIRIAQ